MGEREELAEAAQAGEVVRIRYHGGSQPGAVRRIVPLAIDGRVLKARCLEMNEDRKFVLDKIEILRGGETRGVAYDSARTAGEPESLREAFARDEDRYAAKGWHLVLTSEEVGLYRPFLNGALRKSPDVFLAYRREGADGQAADTPNPRPWYVRSNIEGIASSFGSLERARERFNDYAWEAQERVFGVHGASDTTARTIAGKADPEQARVRQSSSSPAHAAQQPRASNTATRILGVGILAACCLSLWLIF